MGRRLEIVGGAPLWDLDDIVVDAVVGEDEAASDVAGR